MYSLKISKAMRILRYQHEKTDHSLLNISCALQFGKQYTVGRSSKNTFIIKNEKSISRQHIIFEWIANGKEIWITNMGKLSYLDDTFMNELENKRIDTNSVDKLTLKLGTKPVIIELENFNCSINIDKDDPLTEFGIDPIDFESLDDDINKIKDVDNKFIICFQESLNPFRSIYYLLNGIKMYRTEILSLLYKNLSLAHDNFDEIWYRIIKSNEYVMNPESTEGSELVYIYLTNKLGDSNAEDIKFIKLLKNGKICYSAEELRELLQTTKFEKFCLIEADSFKPDTEISSILKNYKLFTSKEVVELLLANSIVSAANTVVESKESGHVAKSREPRNDEEMEAFKHGNDSLPENTIRKTDRKLKKKPIVRTREEAQETSTNTPIEDIEKDINPTPVKKRKITKRKVKSLNPFDFFAGGAGKNDTVTNDSKENDKPQNDKPQNDNNIHDNLTNKEFSEEPNGSFHNLEPKRHRTPATKAKDIKAIPTKNLREGSPIENSLSSSIGKFLINSQRVRSSLSKNNAQNVAVDKISSNDEDYSTITAPSLKESQLNKGPFVGSESPNYSSDHNLDNNHKVLETNTRQTSANESQNELEDAVNNHKDSSNENTPVKNPTVDGYPTLRPYRPPTLVETIQNTKEQETKRIKSQIVQIDETELTEEAINQLGSLSIVEVKDNLIRQRPIPKESDSYEYKGRKNFKKFVKVWPKSQQKNNAVTNHANLITRSYIPLMPYSRDGKSDFDDMEDIGSKINEQWTYSKEENTPKNRSIFNETNPAESHGLENESEDEMANFSFNRTRNVQPEKGNGLFVSDDDDDDGETAFANNNGGNHQNNDNDDLVQTHPLSKSPKGKSMNEREEPQGLKRYFLRKTSSPKKAPTTLSRPLSAEGTHKNRRFAQQTALDSSDDEDEDDDDDGPRFKFKRTK